MRVFSEQHFAVGPNVFGEAFFFPRYRKYVVDFERGEVIDQGVTDTL